jgi:hypothetical protein
MIWSHSVLDNGNLTKDYVLLQEIVDASIPPVAASTYRELYFMSRCFPNLCSNHLSANRHTTLWVIIESYPAQQIGTSFTSASRRRVTQKISHTPRHPTASSPPMTPSARLPVSFHTLLPITLASYGLRPHVRSGKERCCRHAPTLEITAVAASVLGVALGCACSSSSPALTRSTPPPPRSWSCSRYGSYRFGAPFIGDDGLETGGRGGVSAASRWQIVFSRFEERKGKQRGRREALGQWPAWPLYAVY